jgi:CYTH domain-containing protein
LTILGHHYVLCSLGVNMNENVEIERRFLIDGRKDKPWQGGKHIEIQQYYLSEVTHENGIIAWRGKTLIEDQRDFTEITTWRIRSLVNEAGFKTVLTGKGKRVGATATEYEWDIIPQIFENLNLKGLPTVVKTRYLWTGEDGLLWEVDEFEGSLSGLIIAEVELEREDQEVIIPFWVGLELTHLKGWSNAALAEMLNQA